MNGVRKLFSSAAPSPVPTPSPEPINPNFPPSDRPSWPPSGNTPPDSPVSSSPKPPSTSALFLRRGGSRGSVSSTEQSPPVPPKPYAQPVPGPSSPRVIPRKSVSYASDHSFSSVNTRDDLLMSLLASEAVVDSRGCEVLSTEEVEDLKKEHQVLTSRLGAATKKLALETKIRDAAVTLSKVNASHKAVSKQTEAQLEAANARVDVAQKDLWRISQRASDVSKRLLEHRAAVLSISVRKLEKRLSTPIDGNDSGYNTPTTTQSIHSTSSSRSRFDGAHFFAGHADAVVPKRSRSPSSMASDITVLEKQLKSATDALGVASKKQAEMKRELSILQLEKQEMETVMTMELQSAEDTISALEAEIPRLEEQDNELQMLIQEKDTWLREREQLERRLQELSASQQGRTDEVLDGLQQRLQEKEDELQRAQLEAEVMKDEWENVRANLEDEKLEDLARLQEESDRLRQEDSHVIQKLTSELEAATDTLRGYMEDRGVMLSSMDTSLKGLIISITKHVDNLDTKLENANKAQREWEVTRKKLEEGIQNGLDKRETLVRDLEIARQEREEIRRESHTLEERLKRQPEMARSSPRQTPVSVTMGDSEIVAILRPIWAVLPSPEARAAKTGGTASPRFRTGSPSHANSPTISSLAELDVRSLKSLYDATKPGVPVADHSTFTIEAFASRVQALVADDRALIERLIRFAQAHDMLKKNADRAQKLAQESNNALETYQKQVRALEDRNMALSATQSTLHDQIQELENRIEVLTAHKLEIEMHAAEQAETCRQLTEANNTLSAKTLTLAEEAASAPEMVKKQLEAQLSECRISLQKAQEELEAMRGSEQMQRIALLDELNSMQTENGQLRAQLRASKK